MTDIDTIAGRVGALQASDLVTHMVLSYLLTDAALRADDPDAMAALIMKSFHRQLDWFEQSSKDTEMAELARGQIDHLSAAVRETLAQR